jgi:hypothetical protein
MMRRFTRRRAVLSAALSLLVLAGVGAAYADGAFYNSGHVPQGGSVIGVRTATPATPPQLDQNGCCVISLDTTSSLQPVPGIGEFRVACWSPLPGWLTATTMITFYYNSLAEPVNVLSSAGGGQSITVQPGVFFTLGSVTFNGGPSFFTPVTATVSAPKHIATVNLSGIISEDQSNCIPILEGVSN